MRVLEGLLQLVQLVRREDGAVPTLLFPLLAAAATALAELVLGAEATT